MDQPFLGIERQVLAQIGAMLRGEFRGDRIRVEAEPGADRQRCFVGRRALGALRNLAV